jgi:hypothetical protein
VSEADRPEPVLWFDDEHPSRALRRTHQTMLAIAVGVLVLSVLLVIRSDQKVALWCLPNWPAPETTTAWVGCWPC